MHPDQLENNTSPQTQATTADKVWTFVFALMYPIITIFGILFTAIVAVFSAISRVFVFFLRLIRK